MQNDHIDASTLNALIEQVENAPLSICGISYPHAIHPDSKDGSWQMCANCLIPIQVPEGFEVMARREREMILGYDESRHDAASLLVPGVSPELIEDLGGAGGIRSVLDTLDGSRLGAVSHLSGLSREQIEELGGIGEE